MSCFRPLAWLTLTAALAAGSAAAAPIYKCFDRSLGVLYTDEPCKGELVDIRAGNADPVALAELQREREAVSRSAAMRIAANQRAPDAPVVTYVEPPPVVAAPYVDYGYGYPGVYGYAPRADRGRPDAERGRYNLRTVPMTPSQLPRR
ncbi:MAG: hypothetical protein U1F48_06835 [Burkholderiales bacterium]